MDGDNNLESAAIEDLNEMEAADSNFTDVKIIVLIDRVTGYDISNDDWTGTRLYEITEDSDNSNINSTRLAGMGLEGLDTDELNMGDPDTITDFVSFVKETYESELYSLIMWNHGGGWRDIDSSLSSTSDETTRAICWDDTSGDDALYMEEVSSALNGENLAVIGFDACLMGMLEVGYQLKDSGNIMVASEENEPEDGWDYDGLLSSFINTDKTGTSLAASIVNAFENEYGQGTLSAVNLTVVDDVVDILDTFLDNLMLQEQGYILEGLYYSTVYNNSYIDLYQFVNHFSELGGAKGLKSSLDNYILSNFSGGTEEGSQGTSIYFPSLKTDYEYSYYNASYISFPGNSEWDEMLDYALTFIEDEYEDDDELSNATTLINNVTQTHNFDDGFDVDWFKFTPTLSTFYTISTSENSGETDTTLFLYSSSSNTYLEYNDDINSTLFSEITIELSKGETYYLLCTSYNNSYVGEYNITMTHD